jgi:dimethylamine/trimethylamine dehydrogenase
MGLGIEIITSHKILKLTAGIASITSVYSQDHRRDIAFDTIIMVTSRQSDDSLYLELSAHQHQFKTLRTIGDCHAPGTVAAAVYDGHSAARYLESAEDHYAVLFRREMPALDNMPP